MVKSAIFEIHKLKVTNCFNEASCLTLVYTAWGGMSRGCKLSKKLKNDENNFFKTKANNMFFSVVNVQV